MTNPSKRNLMAMLRKEYMPKESLERVHSSELKLQEDSIKLTNTVDGLVFGALQKYGPVTRPRLVELTGLPRTTLYDSLIRLILKGFVRKFDEERTQRGRPKVFYQLSI